MSHSNMVERDVLPIFVPIPFDGWNMIARCTIQDARSPQAWAVRLEAARLDSDISVGKESSYAHVTLVDERGARIRDVWPQR